MVHCLQFLIEIITNLNLIIMKIVRKHNLDFKGFYGEHAKASLPSHSGLYFVYRGIRNKQPDGKFTCSINQLLYIGQAEDVNDRVNGEHEHYDEWCNYLKKGEMLYYSTCQVDVHLLDELEAACIYQAQPPVNIHCKKSYNYNPVKIKCSGRVKFIDSEFNVG